MASDDRNSSACSRILSVDRIQHFAISSVMWDSFCRRVARPVTFASGANLANNAAADPGGNPTALGWLHGREI
jgi:hypothetical protein